VLNEAIRRAGEVRYQDILVLRPSPRQLLPTLLYLRPPCRRRSNRRSRSPGSYIKTPGSRLRKLKKSFLTLRLNHAAIVHGGQIAEHQRFVAGQAA
jgi:hypothetical protein